MNLLEEIAKAGDFWSTEINLMLEKLSSPVRLKRRVFSVDKTIWEFTNDAHLSTTLEQLYSRQDDVLTRMSRTALCDISKDDAIFMCLSLMFDWLAMEGRAQHSFDQSMPIRTWVRIARLKGWEPCLATSL